VESEEESEEMSIILGFDFMTGVFRKTLVCWY
jgi:hypothetical protein